MTSKLRVLVEEPTRGKRWVAIAADSPGLERGAKSEDEAVAKLVRYVPRYLPVAKRAGLDDELAALDGVEVVGRHPGTGSTDFWGISFAPSVLDRGPFDAPAFDRQVRLLRAAWAEFDATAASVSTALRLGPRGGGRTREGVIRHVLRDVTPRGHAAAVYKLVKELELDNANRNRQEQRGYAEVHRP